MSFLVKAARWWVALFNPMTVVCWCIGAIIATTGTVAYYNARPPGTLLSMAEDAEYSTTGDGKLILLVHADRHRFCPSSTHRWLMHRVKLNGKEMPIWRSIGAIPTPPTALGDQLYGLELDIPSGWDVKGTYYASRTDFGCGLMTAVFNPAPTQTGPLPINDGVKASP